MTHPSAPQLTVRAAIIGMLLGGVLSLSNLYIVLKSGWSFGVTITAGILAFAMFRLALSLRIVKTDFGVLENNAMQSVASAAGYMTGGGTAAAIPAVMMITGQGMAPGQMFVWITAIAFLGVIMAIPMKQQMIDIEQLRFPSGVAAAETLKALHGGKEGTDKARMLGISAVFGAIVAFFRDHEIEGLYKFADKIQFPGTLKGRPLADYTIYLSPSVLLAAGGAIMGWRAAWSVLLGACINYFILVPELYEAGVIPAKLGYKNIVGWSVWFGSALLLTSGLTAFAFQWRSVLAAMKSVTAAFSGKVTDEGGQVPMSWFVIGMVGFGAVVVALEYILFGIHPLLGVVSIGLGFFTAIVACRVTGETDTTPTGALGKITQITFGVLAPGNVVTNLMTANVTAGVGLHSADLLTDLKSGWILGANPRQQFWGQFLGVMAGSAFVVPAYSVLIRSPEDLGTEKWPVPGAQSWKGVAEMLAKGLDSLHPTAQLAILVGAVLGIVMVLVEKRVPSARTWLPAASGLGLGFTVPCNNAFEMFLGALLAYGVEKVRQSFAERTVVPTSSGLIAGESLMGVALALWAARGLVAELFSR